MNTEAILQKLLTEIDTFLKQTSDDANDTIFDQYKLIRSLAEELSNRHYTNKDYYQAFMQVNSLYDPDHRFFQDKAVHQRSSIENKSAALSHLQQKVRQVELYLKKSA